MKNINLIRKIAWSFHKTSGIDVDDLFQEASLAYLESMKTYQPNKGKLSTYVWICINNHLKNFLKKETRFQMHIVNNEIINENTHSITYNTFLETLSNEARQITDIIFQNKMICQLPRKTVQQRLANFLSNKHKFSYKKIWTGFRDIELAVKNI